MAVGQLLDYARHVTSQTKDRRQLRCAVLVPAKPHPDLIDLARSVDIDVIWRCEDGGFCGTGEVM